MSGCRENHTRATLTRDKECAHARSGGGCPSDAPDGTRRPPYVDFEGHASPNSRLERAISKGSGATFGPKSRDTTADPRGSSAQYGNTRASADGCLAAAAGCHSTRCGESSQLHRRRAQTLVARTPYPVWRVSVCCSCQSPSSRHLMTLPARNREETAETAERRRRAVMFLRACLTDVPRC
jgi:hypothetical protein